MRCLRTALPLATHGASCLAAAAAGSISRNDCDACGDCAACGGRSVTFGMASGVALMPLTSNWDVKMANLFRMTGHDEFSGPACGACLRRACAKRPASGAAKLLAKFRQLY